MGKRPGGTGVSEVFAQNLQQLIAGSPSISAVCRDLEINRTQFNRYLSGEAHPRPEVLARICNHFGCDARILLEPLAEIRRQQMTGWPFSPYPNPFEVFREGFDHARLPDGLYQMILPNMLLKDRLVVELGRIFTTEKGVKGLQYGNHKGFAESIGASTRWYDRKRTGFVQQHIDGVSILVADPNSRLMLLGYVTYGFHGNPTIHTGFAAMTLAAGPQQSQVQPFVLRKLPPSCAEVLAARRKQPRMTVDDLPRPLRMYIEDWRAP